MYGGCIVSRAMRCITELSMSRHIALRAIVRTGLMLLLVTILGCHEAAVSSKLPSGNASETQVAKRLETAIRLPMETNDASLERYLSEVTGVENLSLHQTLVTDAGLRHVGQLTELKELWLGRTQFTDAGL
jgi:hypothetical protein